MLLTVQIPAGLFPGDPLTVEVSGQSFTVTVPDGCVAGMDLEVDLPVDGGDEHETQQARSPYPSWNALGQ